MTRERDTHDRRRVLVACVPEWMVEFGALWERLGGAWVSMVDTYADEEIALLTAHMQRTVELSTGQVARLRAGDFDA